MSDMSIEMLVGVLVLLASVSGLSISVSVKLVKRRRLSKLEKPTFKTTSKALPTNVTLTESSSDIPTVIPPCSKGCKACILTLLAFLMTLLRRLKR